MRPDNLSNTEFSAWVRGRFKQYRGEVVELLEAALSRLEAAEDAQEAAEEELVGFRNCENESEDFQNSD